MGGPDFSDLGIPEQEPLSFRTEADLRRSVRFTPAEQVANQAAETSEATRAELESAIATAPHPTARAALEDTYRRDFGAEAAGLQRVSAPASAKPDFSDLGVPEEAERPAPARRRGDWGSVSLSSTSAPATDRGQIDYLITDLKVGWNTLRRAAEGAKLAEFNDLQAAFERTYTPEQVAADPKLREEQETRKRNIAEVQAKLREIEADTRALQLHARPSYQALQAANSGEWTMENLARLGKTLVDNPGAAVSIVTQSGPASAAMLAAAVLARFSGFSPGVAAGAGGLASQTVEFGNDYAELREQGVAHDEAYRQALIKSGVIGALDAVSMSSAGKALDNVLGGGGFFGKVKTVGKELGKQSALGMVGEAGGSLLSGRTPDPMDVMAEGIGELAMGPVEAITTFSGRPAGERRQDDARAPVPAAEALGRPQEPDSSLVDEPARQRLATLSEDDPALTLQRIEALDEQLREASDAPEDQQAQEALRAERESLAETLMPVAATGRDTAFTTESGVRINARFAVVEADELIASHRPDMRENPDYPAELQPRDRSRAASELQVAKIEGNLQPERLGESGDAGTGAPIVGADGLVESGNARTIGIQRAYSRGSPSAQRYRDYVVANAAQFGIDPDAVANMRAPVVVRIRRTPVNRVEFARQANQATVAQMSPAELARTDAARMGSLEGLEINDDGEFMLPANEPIIRGFFRSLPVTEQAALVDQSGRISQAGYVRFRNALLAKAYGQHPVVERLAESMSPLLRNLTNALIRMAPMVARAKESMQQGAIADRDITDDIVRAVDELIRMRQEGRSLGQTLAQMDAFDRLTPEVVALMEFLDENVRSPARIGQFIQAYLGELERYGSQAQGDMFGGVEVPGRAELIQTARAKVTPDGEAAQDQQAQGEPGVRGGAEAPQEPAAAGEARAPAEKPADVPGADATGEQRDDGPAGGAAGETSAGEGAVTPAAKPKPRPKPKPPASKPVEKPEVAPAPEARDNAGPSPAPAPTGGSGSSIGTVEGEATPLTPEQQAQADLEAALGDLGDLLGKPGRLGITPEQEAKLVPILTRLFDAAFRLGYHKFKRAAKFVLDTVRAKLGREVADQISIEHLQGAYIGMSGKYRGQGADAPADVVTVDTLEAIEAAEEAQQPDAETKPAEAETIPAESETQQPATVDEAAHEAATSPQSDRPLPTDGQKEAGNYAKGHVRIGGLDISIENPVGSVRSGVDRDGKRWEVKMRAHYGYIRGTVGKDKDHIDVFVRPGTPTDYEGAVFVVDQNNADGSFDEHKVMLGWPTWEEARAAYLQNYTAGWESRIRGYSGWTMERFRTWLKTEDTKKPAGVYDDQGLRALKAAGLKVVKTRTKNGTDVWEVSGNTREHSDLLKRLGGRWYGPKKVWSFYKGDPTADIAKALGGRPAAAAPAETPAQQPATPSAPAGQSIPPHEQIADWVNLRLQLAQPFTSADLFGVADRAYGGTQAQGTYTPKDAYDALELGVNKFMRGWEAANPAVRGRGAALGQMERIKRMMERLPSQTKRTQEQDEFQQFSTPPTYAFLATWLANIRKGEVFLEPSAGIGGLAVFAKNAGATVVVNEFSPRRAEILRSMGFDRVFTENAEQLDNVLPDDVQPSVIVMNPPFSATAGRIPGQRDFMNGARHIEQALARLQPNGRLVVIMGKGRYEDSSAWSQWMERMRARYNLRADVTVDGREYAKYGTTFDVRFLVFDKTGPTGPRAAIVRGEFGSPAEAVSLLEGVRNDRPQDAGTDTPVQSGAAEPPRAGDAQGGGAGAGAGRPVSPATAGVGDRQPQAGPRPDAGATGTVGAAEPGAVRGPGEPSVSAPDGGRRDGRDGDGQVRSGQEPAGSSASAGEPVVEPPSAVEVAATEEAAKAELTESVFEEYAPQRLSIPGAKGHPGRLVQSAAMASVQPPAPTYSPNLPKDVIDEGKLSLAQLEAVVYAGQAHSQLLPSGERMGFFIGDGTGVGKGREISGIILDNFRQGRKRAVWISEKQGLYKDARRDFAGVGGDPDLIFKHSATKYGERIKGDAGILFTTYATMRQDKNKAAQKQGKKVELTKSRVEQIVEWLGEDFDGVIVFDEAHNMGNAIAMKGDRGVKDPSDQALAGVELQRRLPKARVVYVSATGATEVSNLSYATRLGLWGEGTPFPTVHSFIGQIEAGGLSGMELVARDMKQLGVYLARSLSFDGVTYSRLEHPLTELQRDIYNELAKAWQIVLLRVNEALETTGAYVPGGGKNGKARAAAMSAFWGAHQRFFNQVITSMQMPAVIEQMHKDLAAGEAVVLQLVNTNEAIQNRKLATMGEDDTLEELDLTPRENLIQYIKNSFPIVQYEQYQDPDTGAIKSRPVVDSAGNAVISKEAVAARDALIETLQNIRVPDGPLEIILNEFGHEAVAEVTGRGKRVIRVKAKDGTEKTIVETRAGNAAQADAEAFLADKKKILVFSDAGGTGFSFHADLTKKNQRKRKHYLVQPGWRADKAVQGFGRTHRTNQKSEPHYYLVTTDLLAQKRFISSIARRLDQLGALTKGQRDTANQGLFSAKDNLESKYAEDAVFQFFDDMHKGKAEGFDFEATSKMLGFDNLLDPKTGQLIVSRIPAVPQFLNRLLSLETHEQERVFTAFSQRMDAKIEQAIANGTLDAGMQTIKAQSVRVKDEQVVHRDERTGSETKLVELELTHPTRFWQFDEFARKAGVAFYQNIASRKVWAVTPGGRMTKKDGSVVDRVYVHGTASGRYEEKSIITPEKFKPLTPDEARTLWDAENAARPKTYTETMHMVTGSLLPLWDRLPGFIRVGRTQTVDGRRYLGRIIHPNDLKDTLRRLGASSPAAKMAPADVMQAVMERGMVAELANGWKLERRRVSGENRLELDLGQRFPANGVLEELRKAGAFIERIQYQERVFIPVDQPAVLERITANRPVVDLIEPRKGSDEPAFSRRARSGESSPADTVGRYWLTAAQDPEAFRYPKTDAKDAHEIARAMSTPGRELTAQDWYGDGTYWVFSYPGQNLHIQPEIGGNRTIAGKQVKRFYIPTPKGGRAAGQGGSQLYQAALTWVRNNGFIYQPASLSAINRFRTISNMLSSALRFGTTEHMAPSVGQWGSVIAHWQDGNHARNIGSLAIAEQQYVEQHFPFVRELEYDPVSGGIVAREGVGDRHGAGSRALDDQRSDALGRAESGRGRAQRSPVSRAEIERRIADRDPAFERGVGYDTVRRALITRHAQSSDAAQGPATGALYKQSPGTLPGVQPNAIRQMVGEVASKIARKPKGGILVVEFADELPAHLRDYVLSQGAMDEVEGLYDPRTDAIYLVARNIESMQRAQYVLFHETFGHFGLRGLFGAALNAELEIVAANNPNIRAAAAEKRKAFGYDVALSIEEAMADLAGTGRPFTGWKRFFAALQRALRRIGLGALADRLEAITDAEALQVIAMSRSFVEGNLTPQKHEAALAKRDTPTLSTSEPMFYSGLLRAVAGMSQKRAPAAQWKAAIRNLKGVKAEEIEWSGLMEWLDTQTGPVERQAIENFLAENGVRVEEKMLGEGGRTVSQAIDEETVRLTAMGYEPLMSEDDPHAMIGVVRTRDNLGIYFLSEDAEFARENDAEAIAFTDNTDAVDNELFNVANNLADLHRAYANGGHLDDEGAARYERYTLPGGKKNYRELLLTLPSRPRGAEWDFQSAHFDTLNIVAHVRFDEREDGQGNRVLFIEEIQSDWAQQAKKRGFYEPEVREPVSDEYMAQLQVREQRNTNSGYTYYEARHPESPGVLLGSGETREQALANARAALERVGGVTARRARGEVPRGPFVGKTEAWVALALKRMIRYAAENGFDKIAWTTGEQQVARYDLSKRIDDVTYDPQIKRFTARRGGVNIIDRMEVEPSDLPAIIGKELAAKLLARPKDRWGVQFLDGIDLQVGGEGMRAFYDTIVPTVANDVLKRLGGGRVGPMMKAVAMQGAAPQMGFEITPKMRQAVTQGMPLFSRTAPAALPAAPRSGIIDRALAATTRAVGIPKLARGSLQLIGTLVESGATRVLGREMIENIKAGVVDKYGLTQAVLDRRAEMYGRQAQAIKDVQRIIEQLGTLTRAELAVLYRAATTADGAEVEAMIADLPEESRAVLRNMKQLVHDLGAEEVRLGNLDAETFQRNEWAYLHRTYRQHELEEGAKGKGSRARRIALLADSYRMRGMLDYADMKRIQNIAPEFWKRKLKAGKADVALKGEKFIRFERRKNRGEGVMVLEGMEDTGQLGRLLEVQYWPASEPVPAKYADWHEAGTWEARFFNERGQPGKVGMWRDFTAEERQRMGEIDDVRYAFAKTMHLQIHNVEVGRYLEWIANTQAVHSEDRLPEGATVIDRDESSLTGLRRVFRPDEWVRVPTSRTHAHGPLKYGKLAGMLVPGPIWNDIRQTVNTRWGPQWWRTALRAWKISKTALSPVVHMNNIMANVIMADWHDVRPRHVLRALDVMLGSRTPARTALLDAFEAEGGSQGMYVLSELQREQLTPILDQLRKDLAEGETGAAIGMGAAIQALMAARFRDAWTAIANSKAAAAGKWPVAKLMALYQAEDQVFRLAAFIQARERGLSDREAGRFARESFLDYDITAPWIRAMRDSAFPFISFTYRAVPMLLDIAANKPHKLLKLAMILGGVNALGYLFSGGDEDEERRLLPEEKAGRILGVLGPKLVRMPWNDEHGSPVFLDVRRFVPVGDFFEVGQTHAAIPILPVAVPGGPLAVLAEIVFNRSQLTGKDITKPNTDTVGEIAAKVGEHVYKAVAPNLPILPGTYSFDAILNAGSGRTDAFGREHSLAQAALSSVGIKLGSYPKDVAIRNLQAKHAAEIREIGENISALRREYERRGITRERFELLVAEQVAKRERLQRELARKIGR